MFCSAKNITKKVLISLMIVLSGILILNSSIYIHTHILADGSIISHAHPYHKADQSHNQQQHQHTNAELILFHNLQILFLTAIPIAFVFLNLHNTFIQIPQLLGLSVSYDSVIKGRAPPILFASNTTV